MSFSFYRVSEENTCIELAVRWSPVPKELCVCVFFFFNGLFFTCFEPHQRFYNVRKIFKNFHTFYLGYEGKFKIAEPVKVEKSFYPGGKTLEGTWRSLIRPECVNCDENEKWEKFFENLKSTFSSIRLFLSLESTGKKNGGSLLASILKRVKNILTLTSGSYCIKNIIDDPYGSLTKKIILPFIPFSKTFFRNNMFIKFIREIIYLI